MGSGFRRTLRPRYHEFDQQGIVFHMWYLMYFEEARNEYFAWLGYPLERLLGDGFDIQVVHVDIDWQLPVRYGNEVVVDVTPLPPGKSSLTLRFELYAEGTRAAVARTVYVIAQVSGMVATSIPNVLRDALDRDLERVGNSPVPTRTTAKDAGTTVGDG